MRYLIVGYPGLIARAALRCVERWAPGVAVDVLVTDPKHVREIEARATESSVNLCAWRGEFDAVDFGLSGADYTRLAALTRRVLWCVEPVRDGGSLERSPLLRGASELVEFCRASEALEGAVYLSTIFALGTTTGTVSESELRVGQKFAERFEEAAAVGERIVERAQLTLPITVARAVPALGDAETGECPPDGALPRLVHALLASPAVVVASFSGEPVHVAPADWLASALVRLMDAPEARGRRVHLADPGPPTDARFLGLVAHACERRIDERPLAGLRGRPQSPLSKLDALEARALRGWAVRWDAREAQALLGEDATPPHLEDYISRLVEWCRSQDAGGSIR